MLWQPFSVKGILDFMAYVLSGINIQLPTAAQKQPATT